MKIQKVVLAICALVVLFAAAVSLVVIGHSSPWQQYATPDPSPEAYAAAYTNARWFFAGLGAFILVTWFVILENADRRQRAIAKRRNRTA